MPADLFHLLVKKPFLLKEQQRTQMNTELGERNGSDCVVKWLLMGDLFWWHERSFAQEYVNGRNV